MCDEHLKQRVDLLTIIVDQLANQRPLTSTLHSDLRDIAALAVQRRKRFDEKQRAAYKILQLESELAELYTDFPELKSASN